MTKILDCTIRDGGYLTNWNFSTDFVKDLYRCAINSGIEYFEIGYKSKGAEAFSSCDEEFLDKIITPDERCKLTVMVEADNFNPQKFSKNSIIKAVRIASYPESLCKVFEQTKILKDMGYTIFFNLMASSRLTKADFENIYNFDKKNLPDVIVVSDTFGALEPNDLENIFKNLKASGYNKIGFHAHNNKNLALENTLKAIELGAYSVDATLLGTGRWAGNTNILDLLKKQNRYHDEYKLLQEKYFNIFSKNYGCNEYTKISAKYNVHPNYVASLLNNHNFDIDKIKLFMDNNVDKLPLRYNSNFLNSLIL